MSVSLLRLQWQITTTLVVLNNRSVFFHSSGSQKTEIMASAELCSLQRLRGWMFPGHHWLLSEAGDAYRLVTCRHSAPVSGSFTCPSPLCAWASPSNTSHVVFRARPHPVWPCFNSQTSANTLFPNKAHSQVPGGHEFLRDTLQPSKVVRLEPARVLSANEPR